jgi:signal transduction histidine kinase
MRSLFIRILLWFLLASTAAGAVVVIANQWFAQPTLLNFFVGGLLSASLEQAREAYERDGPEGLRRFVAAFERGFAHGVHVTDGGGHDLLTGEDVASSALQAGRLNRGTLGILNRGVVLTRATSDGRYRIFLPVGPSGFGPGLWRPPLTLGLLAVVVLCWALARHLSRPVLDLQHAVERFGGGDTSVRSRSRRSDEIGRLARAFDAMADRIDELVQGQRRLLLDISHELRSPLARLTIATDLLRADPHDEASLAQIELEADRLNQLIGEILQASRPDSPETKRRFAPVRLDTLLREVVDACRIEAADGRRLELTIDCVDSIDHANRADSADSADGVDPADRANRSEQSGVTVFGNGELLRRAIENVLRNALRYAPPQTAVDVTLCAPASTPTSAAASASAPAMTLATASAPTARDLRVTVRDRGPGVPDAVLPHLFTPFYRFEADRDRSTGGVGLGLAIARRAVELHGGHIIARNAQPGLQVEIRLEAATPAASATSPTSATSYSARSASTGLTDAARRAGM